MTQIRAIRKSGDVYDVFYDTIDMDCDVPWHYIERTARDLGCDTITVDQSRHRGDGEAAFIEVDVRNDA